MLNTIGVKYSHVNDHILAPSRIEEERMKRTFKVRLLRLTAHIATAHFVVTTENHQAYDQAKGGQRSVLERLTKEGRRARA